jgi:outer membrane scaffolding protein for murein synthesis (MipA/OmpV family)
MNDKKNVSIQAAPDSDGSHCLKRALAVAGIALGSLAIATSAHADRYPLWEAGAGAAVINLPDYRGSDEQQTYVLPIPYVIYRGERLKIDRQRVRGLLFATELAELDLSVNGSVPVKSRDNRAREGMPDLDPTIEIGPSLSVALYRSATKRMSVELRLPLRAVIATDFGSAHHSGWLFHPHINVDLKGVIATGWNLGMFAGPLFGSERYHDYFYGVAPAFATPARPAYDAKGGYSGAQFITGVSKRFQNYWFGAFVKADSVHGASFVDSPLVKRKFAVSGGIAVAWVFARSSELVESAD